MKPTRKITLLAGAGMAMAASSAMGALSFTNGDLILGVQATGGTGSDKNVFFNLGSSIYHRDTPGGNNPFGTSGQTEIGNIGATLALVYGANWYERTDLRFGVVGNLRGNPNSGFGAVGAIDGDPSRTFYVSSATATVGGGVLYSANTFPSASLGTASTSLTGMEGILANLTTEGDGAAILTQGTQPVEWNNGWTRWNPGAAAAFDIFTGGIQQSFGQGTSATYVDLQRIIPVSNGADPAGVVGGGTYETTFGISSTGSIFAVPEPSSSVLGLAAGVVLLARRRRNA